MNEQAVVEIIEFTDPVCTWCWGSEPVLRKLQTSYENKVIIKFIMGGLVKDIRGFRDDYNDIGGDAERSNKMIAKHYLEASSRHGMPVRTEGFNLFTNEYPSSYPANIAYKAAQMESEEVANKFLRRMREASASEAKPINRPEIQIELAGECGLNVPQFIKNLNDGSAEMAFLEDLKLTSSYGANGFPSFLIKLGDKGIMLRGYNTFDTFKAVIEQLTNGEVTPKQLGKSEAVILEFIKTFGHVAPVEISTTFDLTKDELNDILKSLDNQTLINITPAGNGAFITPSSEPLSCDPVTGMCNI